MLTKASGEARRRGKLKLDSDTDRQLTRISKQNCRPPYRLTSVMVRLHRISSDCAFCPDEFYHKGVVNNLYTLTVPFPQLENTADSICNMATF